MTLFHILLDPDAVSNLCADAYCRSDCLLPYQKETTARSLHGFCVSALMDMSGEMKTYKSAEILPWHMQLAGK